MTEALKRISPRARFFLRQISIYILIVLMFIIGAIIISRQSFHRAEELFNERYDAAVAALKAEAEALKKMPLSEEGVIIQQAEALARVLYGVKDNSSDDLRTLCWCVFNRVDCPEFPNTLEEVISQPVQWMQYSESNPVLENLYQIAREELDAWRTGSHRPCDSSYVFMDWTPQEISLRNEFIATPATRYWRIK